MATPVCAVIDYGIGNVFSVQRALERLDCPVTLTSDPETILAADRVILPGVGAFGRAAQKLQDMALDQVIHDYIATGKPFMGICVGMQLLMDAGEEFGDHSGLGLIPGTVRKIEAHTEDGAPCRVPLIGWTPVEESYTDAWNGTPFQTEGDGKAFYFVHSFHAELADPKYRIAQHRLGTETLTSAVRKDNVLGVQFHPERSAETGQQFLQAFVA
ncbi:MAG: imidazole glycerol phosphate synthase subunit HisH [Paracoccaceae bacterium]